MIICFCEQVKEKEIKRAIRKGAQDLRAIEDACGAGSGCCHCLIDIIEILKSEIIVEERKQSFGE